MLQRPLIARTGVASTWVGLASLAIMHCGGGGYGNPTRASSQAIIGGSVANAPNSPVLLLMGPEGECSAVLVAPTLVLTARHCVASATTGDFTCTAAGDVVNTGDGAGQLGPDNQPETLTFFSVASVSAGQMGTPDAVGAQVISTQSPTSCRDDLAFVVLDRAIPGLVPMPIRITRPTSAGEAVSVWGYGLTEQLDPTALRVVDGVPIEGVGPDMPPESPQLAPLRAITIGPVTCEGDSGGPIVSGDTGAVIAVVSLGSQAGSSGPYCSPTQLTDTTGPRLAAYTDWIVSVFQQFGVSPTTDGPSLDAATDDASTGETSSDSGAQEDTAAAETSCICDSPEAEASIGPDCALGVDGALGTEDAPGTSGADGALPNDAPTPAHDAAPEDSSSGGPSKIERSAVVGGGSCTTAVGSRGGPERPGAVLIALAWTAAAVGRRRQ